jgi:hypothetical protein
MAPLRFIENVLKCGTATFATWSQLYDNNCFVILYFVSGKVEQNESVTSWISSIEGALLYNSALYLLSQAQVDLTYVTLSKI